jgi:ssDNA-binding Zn-finger/Zn-ribbon topoisomerase 1
MPVVSCPNCRVELDLDDADAGHLVECPACLHKFTAPGTPVLRPVPPPPPVGGGSPLLVPPPPLPDDPEDVSWALSTALPDDDSPTLVVKCPACTGDVSILRTDLGHSVECPLCQQTFPARDQDRKRGSRWKRAERDDDDRDDGRHRRSVYDEEDDFKSPKTIVRRAQARLATAGGGLQVLGWIDVAAGILGLIIGLTILAGTFGGNGREWVFGLLNAGPGLSGVILGGLKAFGGAAMKQARNRSRSTSVSVCRG